MSTTIPTRIHPKLKRLVEDLTPDEIILLLSWLYENQFYISSVQVNRWRELNKKPLIEI